MLTRSNAHVVFRSCCWLKIRNQITVLTALQPLSCCYFWLYVQTLNLTSTCRSREGSTVRSSLCADAQLLLWSADCEWDALLKDHWAENLLLSALCVGSCDHLTELHRVDQTLKPLNTPVSTRIHRLLTSWRRETAMQNKLVSAAS